MMRAILMEEPLKQKLIEVLEDVETPSLTTHKHVAQDLALLKKPEYTISEDSAGLEEVYEYLRILFCENEDLMTDHNKNLLREFTDRTELHHKPGSSSS